jgi:hypothetical protein
VYSLVPIYDLTERIEFSLEFPYTSFRSNESEDEDGLSDITLVLKTLLFPEENTTPAFLLKSVVKLNNGDYDRGLGSGDKDVGFVLVVTKNTGMSTFHGNLGYTFTGKEKEGYQFPKQVYTMSLPIPISAENF